VQPNKLNGARNIVVGAEKYRWIFTAGAQGSELRVHHSATSAALTVAMPEWRDPWLTQGVKNEPKTMTPAFVARAIQFAIGEGWQPAQNGLAMRATYEQSRFSKRKSA